MQKKKIYTVKITEPNTQYWYCQKMGASFEAVLGITFIHDLPIPVFIVENTLEICGDKFPGCILPTDCIIIKETLKEN